MKRTGILPVSTRGWPARISRKDESTRNNWSDVVSLRRFRVGWNQILSRPEIFSSAIEENWPLGTLITVRSGESTEYNAHAAAAEFGFNSVAVGYEIAQHGWRPGPAQLYTNRFSGEEPGGLAFQLPSVEASPTNFC